MLREAILLPVTRDLLKYRYAIARMGATTLPKFVPMRVKLTIPGRGWRGFHHHASLCIAAYGFLVAERCLFPPQARFTARRLKAPALPKGFQPRGAGAA